jgi:hypothetical protein
MGALGFVELERTRQRIEDTLGDSAKVPPFKAGVVLDADAGKHSHLVPAEPGNAPVCPVEWQARLLGRTRIGRIFLIGLVPRLLMPGGHYRPDPEQSRGHL